MQNEAQKRNAVTSFFFVFFFNGKRGRIDNEIVKITGRFNYTGSFPQKQKEKGRKIKAETEETMACARRAFQYIRAHENPFPPSVVNFINPRFSVILISSPGPT